MTLFCNSVFKLTVPSLEYYVEIPH